MRSAPSHAEEHGRIGIVEARDLLGVEIEEQRPELQRVGQQAEEAVGRLQPAQAVRRQLLVQLADQVVAHLLPAPHRRPRRPGEPEAGGLLDRTAEAVHQRGKVLVGGGLL